MGVGIGDAFDGDTATGEGRLRTTSPDCDRSGDRDPSAGGETHDRVSAVGAPLQSTIARLR
jgi:hypothetical protein